MIHCLIAIFYKYQGYHKNRSYWLEEEMPFVEAAELGTQKVIKDHATIGIVITTDGSFGELSRSDYTHTENKVINELKTINKPFIVIMNTVKPNDISTKTLVDGLKDKYDVPVIPLNVETMNEADIINVLREALYEFPVDHIEFNIPDWIGALKTEHPLKQKFISKMKESITNVDKLRDAENINVNILEDEEVSNAYISSLNTDDSLVTITLEAKDELFNEVLKDLVGENISSKGDLIKLFQEYSSGRGEYESIKDALKQVNKTGYGIVLPEVKDMKLEKPEVIKQGGRYGIKLQAKASSIHLVKVDVESSFEPIIGSELQSKELIEHLMKDENNKEKIWQSEIFGRSLDEIVSEGIQAKLSLLSESSKYKLSQTIQKMVNKGSSNLIAIVL